MVKKYKMGSEILDSESFIKHEKAVSSLPSKIRKDVSNLFNDAFENEKRIIDQNYTIGETVAKSLTAKTVSTDHEIKELSIALNRKIQTLYQAYAVTLLYTPEQIKDLLERAKLRKVIFEWKFFVYLTKLADDQYDTTRKSLENDLVNGKLRAATLNNRITKIIRPYKKPNHNRYVRGDALLSDSNDTASYTLTGNRLQCLTDINDIINYFKKKLKNAKIECILRNTINDEKLNILSDNEYAVLKKINNNLNEAIDACDYLNKIVTYTVPNNKLDNPINLLQDFSKQVTELKELRNSQIGEK